MKRQIIILAIVFLLIVLSMLLYKNPARNRFVETKGVRKPLTISVFNPVADLPGSFRIDLLQNDIAGLSHDYVTIINSNGTLKKQYKISTVYHAQYWNDTLLMYNSDDKFIYYLLNNLVVRKIKVESPDNNIFLDKGGIYYGKDSVISNKPAYQISKYATDTTFSLSDLIEPYLHGVDEDAKYDYTEGQIIDLDSNNLVYLFYKMNKFAVIRKNLKSAKMYKTIDGRERIELKKIVIKSPASSEEYIKFEPVGGSAYIQSRGAADSRFLIVNSNYFEKTNGITHQNLDLYDKQTLKYCSTIEFKNPSGKFEPIVDIKAGQNKIFILTSSGKIYSANLP